MTKMFAVFQTSANPNHSLAIEITGVKDPSRVDERVKPYSRDSNWFGVAAETSEEAIKAYKEHLQKKASQTAPAPTAL